MQFTINSVWHVDSLMEHFKVACFSAIPSMIICVIRPVFTHGPSGPGPRAANFQGWHIKKIDIEVWYAGKKGCPRERNLREIYTETNVGTEFSRYDDTGARRS